MVSKVNCGITGSTGVLGALFVKKNNFNFIKFKGNITNKNQVYRWVKINNFDLVLHFAAIAATKNVNNNYKYALDVNFQGTKNLIDAIVKNKNNIKWFFFSSTSHVYDFSKKQIKETDKINPISKYGFTKFKAEKYIENMSYKYNFKYCIGRIFSFSSPKQSSSFLIPSLKRRIMETNKNIIHLENLNHYRDFISLKDVCRAVYFLWKKKFNGIINVASGNKFYLKNIARKMAKKKNKKLFFLNNNKETSLVADISKLKKLGWKPKYKNTFSGIF